LSPTLPIVYGPLFMGSQGHSVTLVQRALKIATDGAFGVKTDAAVRRFQHTNRLKSDGIVGLLTTRALGLLYQEGAHPPVVPRVPGPPGSSGRAKGATAPAGANPIARVAEAAAQAVLAFAEHTVAGLRKLGDAGAKLISMVQSAISQVVSFLHSQASAAAHAIDRAVEFVTSMLRVASSMLTRVIVQVANFLRENGLEPLYQVVYRITQFIQSAMSHVIEVTAAFLRGVGGAAEAMAARIRELLAEAGRKAAASF
jgi:Putative peptidoglycan binding domain